MTEVKTALISVYAKEGIDVFTQKLVDLGWQILASGGTARFLKKAGIPVKDVAELVGGDAILGHRVVTLSREVHAGLLSRIPEDDDEMKRLKLSRIDLVCCDFYPLSDEIAKPDCTIASVVEMTDIGGPTMVRSAAKGGRIVICDPVDRQMVIEQLEATGDVDKDTRQSLRAKAEFTVARYCLDAARFHSGGELDGMVGRKVRRLAYGENRDQSPADLFSTGGTDDPLAWDKFKIVSALSGYINMADGDRTLDLLCLMVEAYRRNFQGKVPYIAIACKHGNPCGAAISWDSPEEALLKALLGDSMSVMGAEVMTNFAITGELAQALFKVSEEFRAEVDRDFWCVDVVFAPGFDDQAIELLGKKERRRLLANPALTNPMMPEDEWVMRPVRGGWLKQKAPKFIFDATSSVEQWIGQNSLSSDDLDSLIIAWAVTWRANSNTVALAKDNMLIALGCGQMDRQACVVLCLQKAERAGHDTRRSVFASDAFFPYAQREGEEGPLEGPELLARAGCIGGIVPADGKNLSDVIKLFKTEGMIVAFLPKEHRGFSQH